jgi:threonine aldolase
LHLELTLKTIDLRSDTVTHPTDEMRLAMSAAEVGDDVYGEDPTVNRLEAMSAMMMGKEAALFTPSGTMSNLIATLAQTQRGDEIVVGSEAHMFWYEVGGMSALGGVMPHTVPNNPDGTMDLAAVEAAIRSKNVHYPPTTLLCLENTHNRCGGAVLSAGYIAEATALAHRHGLRVHIDGARIFNAAIALGVPAADVVRGPDSVSFCISKGLSAPVGSLLCGGSAFVDRARKYRKMLGGGMRQAGVLAAAGIVALDKMIGRLSEDHATARYLVEGLSLIPGIKVQGPCQTNIVMFEVAAAVPGHEFARDMESRGVRLSPRGGQAFRAVTHRMITAADSGEALERIKAYLRERGQPRLRPV